MKKVKTQAKIFISDNQILQNKIIKVMDRIEHIVGASLGPCGKNVLIESDLAGIPNKNTKDGVSIFRSLGSHDPYEHVLIEQTRDAAIKTVNEAGDGPAPLFSKILTPNGFTTMGEIKEGMEICGTNGTIQTVLGVYPKGKKEMYEVRFGDGNIALCCSSHLWAVTDREGNTETKPLSEITKDYRYLNKSGNINSKYYVQNTTVYFNENKAQMPLEPYLVGLLIGDGSLTGTGSIELSLGKKKEHILNKIILPTGLYLKTSYIENKNYFRCKIQGKTPEGKNIFDFVKEIGLYGTNSHTKHIPKVYLNSSLESRMSLFRGLMDTDGHCKSEDSFEYSTVSELLKDDFVYLCRSLGKSVSVNKRTNRATGSYSQSPVYRIFGKKGHKYGNDIVEIIPTGRFEEMQCIKVSNPDHLYITDDFVVTHNTTTATIIASAFIKNLFDFSSKNPKQSPQRIVRQINRILKEDIIPIIDKASIKVSTKNMPILEQVAKVSANGDSEMAKAVIEAFDTVGYGSSSHVTIQEVSGPHGYKVQLIEGLPITKGYEETIGKFHAVFINDQANQRCLIEKPNFILFDGKITDMIQIQDILEQVGQMYVEGNSDMKNWVIVAHAFSEQVLTTLSYNFPNPGTINIVPLATPLAPYANPELEFLRDVSAFTGAKIFDMNNPMAIPVNEDSGVMDLSVFGSNMEKIEIYRFRSTIVGTPDELNIEQRCNELNTQKKNSDNKWEQTLLEERVGKLSNGIAQLKIIGSSVGELKERADRAEDAVCAVRAAISHGCLPGGCRVMIDVAQELGKKYKDDEVVSKVIIQSLLRPFQKLLSNAGYTDDEIVETLGKLIKKPDQVFDVENHVFGKADKLGLYDATLAVKQSLVNAVSIASVLGTMGGIVVTERDYKLENQRANDDHNFNQTLENAGNLVNESNLRP